VRDVLTGGRQPSFGGRQLFAKSTTDATVFFGLRGARSTA
jgi:hypothetical protein